MNTRATRLFHHIIYAAVIGLFLAGVAKADKVTDWNAIGSQVIINNNRGGAHGMIDLA